jgi:hypothetical protein
LKRAVNELCDTKRGMRGLALALCEGIKSRVKWCYTGEGGAKNTQKSNLEIKKKDPKRILKF